MVSASEVAGMTSTVDVCVDPDVDDIELQLIVELTATNVKASEFLSHIYCFPLYSQCIQVYTM